MRAHLHVGAAVETKLAVGRLNQAFKFRLGHPNFQRAIRGFIRGD